MTQHLLSKRLQPVAAWALLSTAMALAPSGAFAQSGDGDGDGDGDTSKGDIFPRIVTIGGESQDTVGTIWINLQHCQDDATMVLEVDELPDRRSLDVYVGRGANCASAEGRDGDGEQECDFIQTVEIEGRVEDVPIEIRLGELIATTFGGECAPTSSIPTLWFLAVDSSMSTGAVDQEDYGTLDLNIDTDPPNAPTRIRGGRGENEIPVSWSVGSSKVDSFEIYVDSSGGVAEGGVEPEPSDEDGGTPAGGETSSECGSGALRAGASADDVISLLRKSEGSATATSTTLSASAIDGDSAAIAVVALDEADNRSPLSEIACVFVEPTRGIKDLYEEKYGEIPQGCPCAAAGPAQLEGALPIALALGLIAYRRRRRS